MVMEKAKLTRYLDKIRLGNKITQTQKDKKRPTQRK